MTNLCEIFLQKCSHITQRLISKVFILFYKAHILKKINLTFEQRLKFKVVDNHPAWMVKRRWQRFLFLKNVLEEICYI